MHAKQDVINKASITDMKIDWSGPPLVSIISRGAFSVKGPVKKVSLLRYDTDLEYYDAHSVLHEGSIDDYWRLTREWIPHNGGAVGFYSLDDSRVPILGFPGRQSGNGVASTYDACLCLRLCSIHDTTTTFHDAVHHVLLIEPAQNGTNEYRRVGIVFIPQTLRAADIGSEFGRETSYVSQSEAPAATDFFEGVEPVEIINGVMVVLWARKTPIG